MPRRLLLIPLLFILIHSVQAETLLHLKRNQQMLIQENQDISVDRWIMEEGSSISFAPGVTDWKIRALNAEFGAGASIDGRGQAGSSGKTSSAAPPRAEVCTVGQNGFPGSSGNNGQSGVNISVEAGIDRLQDLSIMTQGGQGGQGSYGSPGGEGGKADGCHGKAGGDGGQGGDGGDGGRGGDILFRYWITSPEATVSISNYGTGVTLISDGGAAGTAGLGGAGGKGGKGRFENRTGNIKITRESGNPGKNGAHGIGGVAGDKGKILIQAIAAP